MPTFSPAELRALLMEIGTRIVVGDDSVAASVDAPLFMVRLGLADEPTAPASFSRRITLPIATIPARPKRGLRMAIIPKEVGAPAHRDGRLIGLILRARQARQQFMPTERASPLPATNYGALHLARLARLSFLAPDIVTAILEGRQPATLNARRLGRISDLPLSWPEQRRMLGVP